MYMCTLYCRVSVNKHVCARANKCSRMLRHSLYVGRFPLATTNIPDYLKFMLLVCVCVCVYSNKISSRLASLLHFNPCSFFPSAPFHCTHFSFVYLYFLFLLPWKSVPIAFKTGKYAMMPFYRLSAPVCLYELLCVGNSTTIEFY